MILRTYTLLSTGPPLNVRSNLGSDTHVILIMGHNGTLKCVSIMRRYQISMHYAEKYLGPNMAVFCSVESWYQKEHVLYFNLRRV